MTPLLVTEQLSEQADHKRQQQRLVAEKISVQEKLNQKNIELQNAVYFLKSERDKRIQLETERREMEDRLRQSQRMEAMGTLAGGIAHDFNNILFPVIGFSQLIMNDLPEDSTIRPQLQSVINAADRAKDLVHQILTFSQNTEQKQHPLKPQLIVKEVLKLARASLPSTIKIIKKIPPKMGMVMADPTQIHQIVMNLITNALHAMEENGGELRVELEEKRITNQTLPLPEMTPGVYICLMVSDTGQGMDQRTLKRIFDPYFTTKKRGKGTGLGLAVVHGIVKNMKGDITVHTRRGKGSCFSVYLPGIVKPQKNKKTTPASTAQLNGNEHILVVDDEKAILNMVEQLLKRFGYKVTTYEASRDALTCFESCPHGFDLVITDMTMPGITGDKLVTKIKSIRPEIPVILCTGFSEKMVEGVTSGMKPDKVLMKPSGKDEMLKTIRFLLDA